MENSFWKYWNMDKLIHLFFFVNFSYKFKIIRKPKFWFSFSNYDLDILHEYYYYFLHLNCKLIKIVGIFLSIKMRFWIFWSNIHAVYCTKYAISFCLNYLFSFLWFQITVDINSLNKNQLTLAMWQNQSIAKAVLDQQSAWTSFQEMMEKNLGLISLTNLFSSVTSCQTVWKVACALHSSQMHNCASSSYAVWIPCHGNSGIDFFIYFNMKNTLHDENIYFVLLFFLFYIHRTWNVFQFSSITSTVLWFMGSK